MVVHVSAEIVEPGGWRASRGRGYVVATACRLVAQLLDVDHPAVVAPSQTASTVPQTDVV